MIRIVVGGDVYPSGPVREAFISGNAEGVFGDLAGEFAAADLAVVNLETPLVSRATPIAKIGPVFGADPRCVRGFVAARVGVLNLANNHTFDHGAEGLRETMMTAAGAGLDTVGAGRDLEEARTPLVKVIKGRRVVIYAMAEREFSQADRTTPGANPLDLINALEAIRTHKGDGVFIVLVHGGAEFYPYPSPELRRHCRFLVEMGADAVICSHTHCPLPWEVYRDRPIVYGLGNLILEAPGPQAEAYHEGYLAKLSIEGAGVVFEPAPYVQSLGRPGAREMDPAGREKFLAEMRAKAAEIEDDAFVEDRWREYCLRRSERVLADLLGYRRWMWKLRRLLFGTVHGPRTVLRALHLVQGETHREVLTTLFGIRRRQTGRGTRAGRPPAGSAGGPD